MTEHGWPCDYVANVVNSNRTSPIPISTDVVRAILLTKGIKPEFGNTGSAGSAGLIMPFWDDVVAEYRSGKTVDQISKQFHSSGEMIYKILHLKGVKNSPMIMARQGLQFGSMSAPYSGQLLQEPGQKEAYLKWLLEKAEQKSEQKSKLDAYNAFDLDFAPASIKPDAPTPNIHELFKQVGLPPLKPTQNPTPQEGLVASCDFDIIVRG